MKVVYFPQTKGRRLPSLSPMRNNTSTVGGGDEEAKAHPPHKRDPTLQCSSAPIDDLCSSLINFSSSSRRGNKFPAPEKTRVKQETSRRNYPVIAETMTSQRAFRVERSAWGQGSLITHDEMRAICGQLSVWATSSQGSSTADHKADVKTRVWQTWFKWFVKYVTNNCGFA